MKKNAKNKIPFHIEEGSPLHRLGWTDEDLMQMKGALIRTSVAGATMPLTPQQQCDACHLPTECIYPHVGEIWF